MSALSEIDAARAVIGSLRAIVANLAEQLAELPASPQQRCHHDRLIELRYALLAVVESAIENGMPAASALLSIRDTGAMAWGAKLYVQHSGHVPLGLLAEDAKRITAVMAEGAGVHIDLTTSYSEGAPANADARHSTRH